MALVSVCDLYSTAPVEPELTLKSYYMVLYQGDCPDSTNAAGSVRAVMIFSVHSMIEFECSSEFLRHKINDMRNEG